MFLLTVLILVKICSLGGEHDADVLSSRHPGGDGGGQPLLSPVRGAYPTVPHTLRQHRGEGGHPGGQQGGPGQEQGDQDSSWQGVSRQVQRQVY